jgi:Uma2 family endonuclease
MSVPVAGKYYTLEEYHRLGDIGVLGEDDRVELIEGDIVAMAAIKGPHMLGLNRCTRALTRIPDQPWIVSVQNPVHLFGDTEPQPDIAILRPEADRAAVPEAADVYLVIEISDSTLSYDRGRKRRLYARAGIPEYWIMDVGARRMLRHTGLEGDDYRVIDQFVPGDTIDALVLPAIRLSVAALFA